MQPADPLEAVAHPDPYPYYAALARERPFYHDDRLGLWVAAGPQAIRAVLTCPAARVRPPGEPVPAALGAGPAAQMFGRFIRMNDGAVHERLKPMLTAYLTQRTAADLAEPAWPAIGNDPAQVDRYLYQAPVHAQACLMGLPDEVAASCAREIEAFMAACRPGADAAAVARADQAAQALQARMLAHLRAARGDAALGVLRRLALAGGVEADALAANLTGLLLQSCEAGAGLLGNALVHAGRLSPAAAAAAPDLLHTCVEIVTHVARHDPPLHNTRRFLAAPATLLGQSVPAGAGILVVLAAAHALAEGAWPWTFGAERHACPGRTSALLHAAQALAHALRHGVDAPALARRVRYRPLPNARVPRFHFPPGDTP